VFVELLEVLGSLLTFVFVVLVLTLLVVVGVVCDEDDDDDVVVVEEDLCSLESLVMFVCVEEGRESASGVIVIVSSGSLSLFRWGRPMTEGRLDGIGISSSSSRVVFFDAVEVLTEDEEEVTVPTTKQKHIYQNYP
jgi:hypothetical protein